jgi:hypothetical protein
LGKVLKHPLRAMGAALTAVGASIVFVVFFIPVATAGPKPPGPSKGGSAPGKNVIQKYVDENGNNMNSVGENQTFVIVGKNLNHVIDAFWAVQCWNGSFWTEVESWTYGPDSRSLVDVAVSQDCAQGPQPTQIRAKFDNTSKGNEYAYGPMLYIEPSQID